MTTTSRFYVPGISCEHCQISIEGAVGPTPGVGQVKVDVAAKTVTVDYDPEVTDSGALTGLIEDQGYEVERAEEVSHSA